MSHHYSGPNFSFLLGDNYPDRSASIILAAAKRVAV
jgi:hypothetical protein